MLLKNFSSNWKKSEEGQHSASAEQKIMEFDEILRGAATKRRAHTCHKMRTAIIRQNEKEIPFSTLNATFLVSYARFLCRRSHLWVFSLAVVVVVIIMVIIVIRWGVSCRLAAQLDVLFRIASHCLSAHVATKLLIGHSEKWWANTFSHKRW